MICPNCTWDNVPGAEQCEKCGQDLTQLDLPVAQDRVEKSLMEDVVRLLQPQQAVTLPPTATVRQAIRTMLDHNIGALLIVDEAGRMKGILSERDLLIKVASQPEMCYERPIREFMTSNPESVGAVDSLAFALHKMDAGGYRHLPVIANGCSIGMISVRDMLFHFTRLCKTC